MKLHTIHHSVTVALVSGVVLAANPRRVAVSFAPDFGNVYNVAFGKAAVLSQGYSLQPYGGNVVVKREDIGQLITQPIHAIGSANFTAGITETVEI